MAAIVAGIALHAALKKESRDKYGRGLRKLGGKLGAGEETAALVQGQFHPRDGAVVPRSPAERVTLLEQLRSALTGIDCDEFTLLPSSDSPQQCGGLFVDLLSPTCRSTDQDQFKVLTKRAEALARALSSEGGAASVAAAAPKKKKGLLGGAASLLKKKKKKKTTTPSVVPLKQGDACEATGGGLGPRCITLASGTRFQVIATTKFAPQHGDTVYWYARGTGSQVAMRAGTVVHFPTTEGGQGLVQNGCLNVQLSKGLMSHAAQLIAAETLDLVGTRIIKTAIPLEKLSMKPFAKEVIEITDVHTQAELLRRGGVAITRGASASQSSTVTATVPGSTSAAVAPPPRREDIIQEREMYSLMIDISTEASDAAQWGVLFALARYKLSRTEPL